MATENTTAETTATTEAPATAEPTTNGETPAATETTTTGEALATAETTVTVRCLHGFRDKYTRRLHHKGDIWIATKERFTELTSGAVQYVEEETENG